MVFIGLVAFSGNLFAQTIEDFHVDSAEDLVMLCGAKPDSPNYVAAIHFCHGFGTGAYDYYLVQAAADPSKKFICPPDPAPTRNEALDGFVSWMGTHPQYENASAVDTLFRYLGETYPCK
jgi:hypothetical protein